MSQTHRILTMLRRAPLNYRLAAVDGVWSNRADSAVRESDDLYRTGDINGAVARLVELIVWACEVQESLKGRDSDFSGMSLGWIRCHTNNAILRSDVWAAFLLDEDAEKFNPLKVACRRYGMNVDF